MAREAGGGKETNASQFYITTGLELDSLDGEHTIFGEVSEGLDVLQQIDEAFVDDAGRPLQNIRSVDCRDDLQSRPRAIHRIDLLCPSLHFPAITPDTSLVSSHVMHGSAVLDTAQFDT